MGAEGRLCLPPYEQTAKEASPQRAKNKVGMQRKAEVRTKEECEKEILPKFLPPLMPRS